ncbi:DUF6124 family protein [Pseudomonas batumici]|uniref:DUF3077 domain-containing protein n=1 Tax=Pseudomonas batumici TaxID=226910 RepID=A0A0C2I6L1_9PSED|nr:hypothetical protein [Pseudomonas batumici]KIH84846.1 hypothetical protein UCMB321_1526 [Pseudomonas batumici]
MFKVTPNPPASADPKLDEAVDRVFAHYNLPVSDDPMAPRDVGKPVYPNGVEETLVDVCDILESAAATAYESADQLDGSKRKLALGAVRLIELARSRVDDTLQGWPVSSRA